MKTSFKLFAALFLGLVLITSCSEEEDALQSQDFNTQKELVAFEQEMFTVESWEDNEDLLANGRSASEDYLLAPDCVTKTWTHDPANQTRTLTIDFGDVPCLGRDGLYRRGVIEIVYDGPRAMIGSTRTTTFSDYFVMDHEFDGVKIVEHTGLYIYNRTTDMVFTVGDIQTSRQTDRDVEKVVGQQTEPKFDDIFQVTGSGSGVNKYGVEYTSTITAPLLRKSQPGCYKNFVDGEITFVNEEAVTTVLDYDPLGGAPCDKLASLTRNGETIFITLW